MSNDKFTIDLGYYYDCCGKRTENCEIREEDGYYDLVDEAALYAMDGETCVVVDFNEDTGIYIVCQEDSDVSFALTKREFEIMSHAVVGTCNKCGSPLYRSTNEEYEYECFSCDEDFYGFEQN